LLINYLIPIDDFQVVFLALTEFICHDFFYFG
jgi:hypothetical protein